MPQRSSRLSLTAANPLAGPGNEDKDAASVRADYPVPADLGLYYFEVTVVNKGRDGFIGQLTLLPVASLHVFLGIFKFAALAHRRRLQHSRCEAGEAARLGAALLWVPWR